MKNKSFAKGIAYIVLAIAMLMSIIPMSAMAQATITDDKIKFIDFTLSGYGYGKDVERCTVDTVTAGCIYNQSSFITEYSGATYDPTQATLVPTGYFDAGKQYYITVLFSAVDNMDVFYSVYTFDENMTAQLTNNGVVCETVALAADNNSNICAVAFKLPMLEEAIPMGIDFTTVVKQNGNVAPEKANFELEVLNCEEGSNSPIESFTIGGKTVATNGTGSFENMLTIKNNNFSSVLNLLNEGILVRQKKGNAEGWTYDETLWFVTIHHDPEVNALTDTVATVSGYSFDFYSGKLVNGEFVPDSEIPADKMIFTNTYTVNKTEPKPADPKPEEPKPAEPVKSPKTGDSANMALLMALLFVSGISAVCVGKKVTDR